MTSIHPQTSPRHPLTPSRHHPDTPRYRHFCALALEEKAISENLHSISTIANSCCIHYFIILDNDNSDNTARQDKKIHGHCRIWRGFGSVPGNACDWGLSGRCLGCLDSVWGVWIVSVSVWMMSKGVWEMSWGVYMSYELKTVE